MTKFSRLLATAALLIGTPAFAQDAPPPVAPVATTPVDADPALWVVRDDDTTIYLFGTVHVLRSDLPWFDEAVRTAFDASDELRIEALLPDDPAAMAPLVVRYAIGPAGRTMTSRLTPDQTAIYATGMAAIGVPAAAVDMFEPWLVSLTVAQIMAQRAGYSPDAGAEKILRTAADTAGKPVTAFETVEEQIAMLDSTPQSEQIAGIFATLDDLATATATFNTLVNSWAAGDPDATGVLMNEALATTPETARILLTDRNRRWAETLQARMAQPGTLFVAVGAGHLTGDTSVQHFLAERGLTVTRVVY